MKLSDIKPLDEMCGASHEQEEVEYKDRAAHKKRMKKEFTHSTSKEVPKSKAKD